MRNLNYFSISLLTMGNYPQAAIEHFLYVVNPQIYEVDVCETGEASEHEYVANLFQSFGTKLFLHHCRQLIFRQITPVYSFTAYLITIERVNGNKSGTDCLVCHLLEELHTLVCGVLGVFILCTQEEFQICDEAEFDFSERDVRDIVSLFHELHYTTVHSFVFLISGIRFAEAYQFLGVFKMLLVKLDE